MRDDCWIEPEILQAQGNAVRVEKTQHDGFPLGNGNDRHAYVVGSLAEMHGDTPILGQAPLHDVQIAMILMREATAGNFPFSTFPTVCSTPSMR